MVLYQVFFMMFVLQLMKLINYFSFKKDFHWQMWIRIFFKKRLLMGGVCIEIKKRLYTRVLVKFQVEWNFTTFNRKIQNWFFSGTLLEFCFSLSGKLDLPCFVYKLMLCFLQVIIRIIRKCVTDSVIT